MRIFRENFAAGDEVIAKAGQNWMVEGKVGEGIPHTESFRALA